MADNGKKKSRLWWAVLVLLVAGVGYYVVREYSPSPQENQPPDAPPLVENQEEPTTQVSSEDPEVDIESTALAVPAPGDGQPFRPPHPARPADPMVLTADQARDAYMQGRDLLSKNRFVQARKMLNRAYYSDQLPPDTQNELRTTLEQLAEMTLIGPRTTVFEGDPYSTFYTFQPGDILARVERRDRLHIPTQLILYVNGLARAEDIQAGRTYKMINGPFHAIVDKGRFTMDIFLQREGQDRVFIKRLPVGTGQNGSTPEGFWRVRLGGKEVHPTWYPPPNSPLRGPIPYGHPDYAFGQRGLWISLEGLDDATRTCTDYGIHSTNKPESIGTASSLGCIRLRDEDIDQVYRLLYEFWSTVQVNP